MVLEEQERENEGPELTAELGQCIRCNLSQRIQALCCAVLKTIAFGQLDVGPIVERVISIVVFHLDVKIHQGKIRVIDGTTFLLSPSRVRRNVGLIIVCAWIFVRTSMSVDEVK